MRAIAQWSPARDAWETETTGLFCEHSDVYSEIFPSSGSMRSGSVYERPTSAPLTDGSASSSSPGLLPTPNARDWKGSQASSPEQWEQMKGDWDRPGGPSGLGNLPTAVMLLPTPTARDWKGPNQRQDTSCLHGALTGMPSDDGNAA